MLIIGIAGGTGSGKTTVARSIIEKLGSDQVTFISQDNYYKDHGNLEFSEREKINYDHPLAFDNDLLLQQLIELKQLTRTQSPTYDFSNHSRSARTLELLPNPIIILEGLHVLSDEPIRSMLDIKVFVDTDPDVRILRRVLRDIQERGRSVQSVYDQYMSTVKPMHDAFIEPSKKYADIIIPEGGHNEVGINLLTILTEKHLHESNDLLHPSIRTAADHS
ncbi:uridine kinase [Paenibacillus radicis (ex Xue et al. 2023)]|uniref:Uridine kinase n=1 Tax=Paenibacillus radicis (ex Xue et al. 2023) TaxID=2972489 RepID=A0ABT1YEV7_9BACL|nr:uridine kinase [Paenibacillus radicis (ex Xue et al. 2023)]MCR8631736.1 uridine kinase [Paenibacillus radicis (ex Xue et al. 2023)]